tara:strand:- start:900 stop:2519 length:1620 start_codon:yes stop_codon:yes gene_type:complete
MSTAQQVKENYLGNPNLKRANIPQEFTPEQVEEFIRCSQDPLYFIQEYINIVNIDEGLIPFEPYDFQKEIIELVKDERFVICKMPRQTGKTTTICAVLLWYMMFTESFNIAILAHKSSQSRDILGRIQLAYEHLPRWLQLGIVEWNKGNVELENGSKILAASTSASSIRGGSFNLIYLDEFAFVPTHVQEEFFASVYPTISSGQTSKVLITSTPNGLNLFYKLWHDSEEDLNEYKRIDVHWSDVPGRDKEWQEQTIRNTSEEQFRQEFECEFIGSTNTLISPSVLKRLVYEKPLTQNEHVRVYDEPKPKHIYTIVVDTSRGVNQDYSAFAVIDATELPHKVVCCYQNNEISPMQYPQVIQGFAKSYNEAFVLVESNDIGMAVAESLHSELEVDNVLMSAARGRAGQVLSSGFGGVGQQYLGVRTTKQVKRNGCLHLKTIIEKDQLIINDYKVLEELTHFVQKGESYEAEGGNHDDLVMCLVLYGWLCVQDYYKELISSDIRKHIQDQNAKIVEDDMIPFGFVNDGVEELPEGYAQEGSW